jgi:hypothetical protein
VGEEERILMVPEAAVEMGAVGADDEFFVIKLKDICAVDALRAYAAAARFHGMEEWAEEVEELADRAETHPNRKRPD